MIVRNIAQISLYALLVASTTISVPAAADMSAAASATNQRTVPMPVMAHPLDKEISDLRKMIASTPNDAILHVRLGFLLLKKGVPDEADPAFSEALKLNPRSHAALTGKGIVLSRKGDLKGAEQTLRTALLQNPDPVRTHYELGIVYEKLGDLEKALREYKAGIDKHEQGRK